MTSNIFATEAQRYWDRKLSVLPTEPGTKQPAKSIRGWPGYLAAPPNASTRELWVEKYADRGIALLLGGEVLPGWLLVGVDVDDDRLVTLAEAVIAGLVVGKKGRKGATLFALVPKDPKFKSTVFNGADSIGNIDILAGGKITLMEPSIHPETGLPYLPFGARLIDTSWEDLPKLDSGQLSLLKEVIGSEEVKPLLSGHATHDAAVSLSARLVRRGTTDEQIEAVFRALLPSDYNGNTLDELPELISSARQRGFGADANDGDEQEADSVTAVLLRVAANGGIELFRDDANNAFASVPAKMGTVTHRIPSTGLKMWLRHQYGLLTGKPTSTTPLNEAMATLEAQAVYQGDLRKVFSRVGGDSTGLEVDLGREDGKVASIDGTGWRILESATRKFTRGAGFGELPVPVSGGRLKDLQDLLRLEDDSFRLTLGFLIGALKPEGPYFALLVEGEQGSGKSFFCQTIKHLIDPNAANRLRLPDNDRDLMIHAKEYWLLSYDNASGMKADMSDALCSLATGGGIAVRRLYTDGELHVMSYSRPFVINGISGYANRPDLLERGIPVKLPPMTPGNRDTEEELLARLAEIGPSVLGKLYDAAAAACRDLEKTPAPRNLRMADAARWILAASPALGFPNGEIIEAIVAAQELVFVEKANEDALVIKLRKLVERDTFNGYIGDLFSEIEAQNNRLLPQSPSRLSAALDRLRPAMERAGMLVERSRDNRGSRIKIMATDPGTRKPSF